MKRIIFYAAAVGIFVSSVLAKPARGAGWTAGCPDWSRMCGNVGSVCEADAAPGIAGNEQGIEWFPGQGPEMSQAPEVQEPPAQEQGTEWFPGQGPEMSWTPEAQEPPVQDQGTEWFPGQGPGISQTPEVQEPPAQEQGTEWFPGQGPGMSQTPEVQEPDTQNPWTDWFSGQNPWTDWFPWLNGQSGNSWQQGGGQNGFWWWNGSGQENNGGSQSGGTPGGSSGGAQSRGLPQTPGTGAGGQSGDSGTMASYITRIVELVNVQRAAAGLSPVTASAVLSAAADVRAQEIVGNFSHYRPNGTYFNTVLDQRGISYNGAGENIAYGYDTPERVMTEWMNSASHRANILDSRYTKLGVGYYEQGGVKYWTQMFTY